MKRRTVALLLLLAACSRARPPEELLASAYRQLENGALAEALSEATEGLERARRAKDQSWQRRFRILQAEVLAEQRRHVEALALLEGSPSDPPDPPYLQARLLMTRGRSRCQAGLSATDSRDAAAELAAARRLAAEAGSSRLASEIARHSGTCAMLRGDNATAERDYHDALTGARSEGDLLRAAKAAGNLGLLKVRGGRYDEATEWLDRSLDLASELNADLVAVRALTNLGWCYFLLGDDERSLSYLTRAERLAAKRSYRGERQLALQNIGRVQRRLNALDAAGSAFRGALALAEELGNQTTIAELRNNLAVVALDQGRFQDAAASAGEALRLKRELHDLAREQYSKVVLGQISAARGDYQEAEALYRQVLGSSHADTAIRWTAQATLAQLAAKMQHPAQADAEYREAIALMEQSYSELRLAEHRISFFSSLDQFQDQYLDLLVSSGRSTRALRVADRSRARELRERLGIAVGGPHPDPASVRVAQASVVLFYSLAPRRSFLWALTPRGVQFQVLPGEDEIRDHVEAHQRQVLQSRDPLEEESADADWLFQALVAGVASAIPSRSRVVFIPDGALHNLNPETLIVPEPKRHYWVDDVTLLTAPSLSLLAADAGRSRRWESSSILIMGDPVPVGDEFPRLSQAEREIARIADQFSPVERTIYSGLLAVPSAYRGCDPRRFRFVHFAAHAQANREVPLDSAVILTAENDSAKLYARDVVGLPLRAELVTLSTCRAAGSRAFAGEGLVGLGWAFLSAGAENVVAGLWNVEDASTATLMSELYRGVRHGLPPAEALRGAKLKLVHSATAYRKPFYWAPFLVYTRRLDR